MTSTTKTEDIQNQLEVVKQKNLWFAISMIVLGLVGWFASFMLATEYIRTLENPDYIPGCSISVLVSCSPNMASWQGSLLGFSNTFIGVAGFIIPIVIGVFLLTGIKLQKWMWVAYKIGMGAALTFVMWLIYQSIFNLNTLCPWCMVVWVVVSFMFFGAIFRKRYSDENNTQSELHNWNYLIAFGFLVIVAVIAQIQLDWLSEVATFI